VTKATLSKTPTRLQAANACLEVLDTDFFRALCEPARIQIFRQMVLLGRSDIGTIAKNLPQDRSVIARHLQLMERAGIVRAENEGRHSYYEIDGSAVSERIDGIANLVRALVPFCCGNSLK
jgi:DNA-binding transcriptional ArsR family regulator